MRVWAAGCATGEEAYSLAILLHEHADTRGRSRAPKVQVFATDLGEDAIRTAREGFYPQNIAADLSDEHLKRYFEEERDGYRVRRDIRESVTFAEHNLMSDPPFSQLDLVVCRNLLIYLKREAQSQIFNVFHYALRPGGYLFLGTAESAEGAKERFQAVDKNHCIYRRLDNAAQAPRFEEMPFLQRGREQAEHTEEEPAPPPQPSFEDVRLQILEDYAPPGVVVNEQNDVVHVFKGASRYLRVAQGPPTHDVLEIIRPELRSALRSALFQVRHKQQESRSRPVTLNTDGRHRTIRLATRSMEDSGFVHVRFEENDGGGSSTDGTPSTASTVASAGSSTSAERSPVADLPAEERDEMVEQLETELKETRHELQGTVEEYETSMEELRASNEELQSMNEELRSTTEELETSKEELRSMNEELTTVNQELNNKNEELNRVNSDLQNLLRSTEIATLFLDRELRIQRFTPHAEELFNIIESDRGRPLEHVSRKFEYDGFIDEAQHVLDRLTPVEEEVQNDAGRWFLVQMRPYRTAEDKIDGVVITFVDITERKETEAELRRSEERYRLLLEGVEEYAILMLDLEGRVATWNTGAEHIFGYTEDEIVGRPGTVLYTADDRKSGLFEKRLERARAEGRSVHDHWLTQRDGSRFWGTGVITALWDTTGDLYGFVKVVRDNTERKQAEEKVRALNETLEERVAERTAKVRRLATQITMAEEHERQRIAGILHDDLQQLLYGAEMSVRQLRRGLPGEGALLTGELLDEKSQMLDQIEEVLNESVERTRSLSKELAPPELHDNDLSGTLRWLGDYMKKHFSLSVKVDLDGSFPTVKSRNIHTLLFRLLRELLFNVVKHAETNEAVLQARPNEGNALLLEVRDDGVGFDPATLDFGEGGYGLSEMRERLELLGGRMELTAAPGEGVRVQVAVPHERVFT